MVRFYLSFILVLASFWGFAQHDILERFTGSQFSDIVRLDWTIKGGHTCNGIFIYHSTNDSVYTDIGRIEGVCGSTESSMSYEFEHTSPTPLNYYKLELGFQGRSDAIVVSFIRNSDRGFTIQYDMNMRASLAVNDQLLGQNFELYTYDGQFIETLRIIDRKTILTRPFGHYGFLVLVLRTEEETFSEKVWIR